MVKIYVKYITLGLITIDDVPNLWKEKVKIALEKDNNAN